MEGVTRDHRIVKGSMKCYPPSYDNAMTTVTYTILPTNDLPSGAGLSIQANPASLQCFSGGSGGSSSDNSVVDSSSKENRMAPKRYYTRQHVSSKPDANVGSPRAPSWVLIEWEVPTSESNPYAVIASTQIVDRAPDHRDQSKGEGGKAKDYEYYTGKLIHVQCGQHVLPATIVMVSEDKKFIDTELRQLRNMNANNLDMKSDALIDTQHAKQVQNKVHRNESERAVQLTERTRCATLQYHVDHQNVVPTFKRQRNDSMSSFTTEVSTISPPCTENRCSKPGNMADHRAADRIITPRSDRMGHANVVQPMTFDQQTQTIGSAFEGDSTNNVQLGKVLFFLESMMAEQKSCRMERQYDRKLLQDMQEKLLVQETLLRRMEEKMGALRKSNHTNPADSGREAATASVCSKNLAIELPQIEQCLFTDEDGQLFGQFSCIGDEFVENSAREPIVDLHREANSNQSWMSSVNVSTKNVDVAVSNETSFDEASAVTTATVTANYTTVESTESFIFHLDDQSRSKEEANGRKLRNDKTSHVSTTTTGEEKPSDSIDDLKKDWDDNGYDEEEEFVRSKGDNGDRPVPEASEPNSVTGEKMVSIGPNGTLVKQKALQKINWLNYKSATRKLLLEVFGRELLATHSLSGRPAPALRADVDKPVKDRLEANVVEDVIAMVCKMCKANEVLIRHVITAKCADEAKMRRQRAGLVPKRPMAIGKATTQQVQSTNLLVVDQNKENIC